MTAFIEFLHASPFYELAALLVLAAGLGVIGLLLRQPMIVSYIAVGILAGPSVFGIVKAREGIDQLAELSVAVLLFLVGMKLDFNKIKTLGPVALLTGLGQVAFTSFFGFFIVLALGFDLISAVYISIALTFSSTIIIVKLLSDKQEVDTLHGRIAIGFLIVQDLVVVIALMALSTFGGGDAEFADVGVAMQAAYAITFIVVVALLMAIFMHFLATPLIKRIIGSRELLIVFAISWAALFAAICSFFGFSKELGGLLAGISLASTPFRETIVSKLSSLRDFLLLFFFVSLGTQVDISLFTAQVVPGTILSAFVLIGNPLIVMVIMGYLGYRKRTGLFAGLTVAQISEFSLIFIAMGLKLEHITTDALGLVTLIGVITIATSIYMITYSHIIYSWLEPILWIFERNVPYKELTFDELPISEKTYDVILFGLGKYGLAIGMRLKKEGISVLGLDSDPEAVRRWQTLGLDAAYGDVWDQELFSRLPINSAKWAISGVSLAEAELGIIQEDPRQGLIEGLSREKYTGKIAVSAQNYQDIEQMKKSGADLVFLPYYDAAERAVEKIQEFNSREKGLTPTV